MATITSLAAHQPRTLLVLPPSTRPILCLALAFRLAASAAAQPPASPPTLHLEAVAFDSARGRLVLFGGSHILGPNRWEEPGETWEWDGARWLVAARVEDGPGARRGHGLAYDAARGVVVLFGGVRQRDAGQGDEPLRDSWTFDGRRWSRGPDGPDLLAGMLARLVYDARRRETLLIGLPIGDAQQRRHRLHIWRLQSNGWELADSTGPMVTTQLGAAYDAARSVLVVPLLADSVTAVWEWDGRSWQHVEAPGPSRRDRYALAFDAAAGRVVIAGGMQPSPRVQLADAWTWDGRRWAELGAHASSGPGPRASASLVYDAVRRRLLLYGGVVPVRGPTADLWIRSDESWRVWFPY